MDMNQAFETLNKFFAYEIQMLPNRDGYEIKIWDEYGLMRANTWGEDFREAYDNALLQYKNERQY